MISQLRGTLVLKQAPALVIDVSGVGYEVDVPMSTFFQLPEVGTEVRLLTHFLVREDMQLLFGFLTNDERDLFRNLLKVSGIGARLALTILSGISVDGFVQCVHEGDHANLVRLPGIGKKTAERIIIEMRDKLPEPSGGDLSIGMSASPMVANNVNEPVSALIALGFKPNDAARMVREVQKSGMTTEEIIKTALQGTV